MLMLVGVGGGGRIDWWSCSLPQPVPPKWPRCMLSSVWRLTPLPPAPPPHAPCPVGCPDAG